MDFRSVQDELPNDDSLCVVFGSYLSDSSDAYEVASFRRSVGWNVAHCMNVSHWSYLETMKKQEETKPEPKVEEQKPSYKGVLQDFWRWLPRGD